jgi:hypothetical protein
LLDQGIPGLCYEGGVEEEVERPAHREPDDVFVAVVANHLLFGEVVEERRVRPLQAEEVRRHIRAPERRDCDQEHFAVVQAQGAGAKALGLGCGGCVSRHTVFYLRPAKHDVL